MYPFNLGYQQWYCGMFRQGTSTHSHIDWLSLSVPGNQNQKKGEIVLAETILIFFWKIDFFLPGIFQQPHMVGWVSHQPPNQDQYQTFLNIEYRLGENFFKVLVLTDTKIMFLKFLDRFGFWNQPLVLGYV